MLLNYRTSRPAVTQVLLLLLLCGIPFFALVEALRADDGNAATTEADQITAWVRALGSPSARQREKATTALIFSGHHATQPVADSIATGDYEVRYRAFHILARQFLSVDANTHRAAERALARLSESRDARTATQAVKTLADLIAQPRAAAISALQNQGAQVKVGGSLGDPKTPIEVSIDEDWGGRTSDLQILQRVHNLQTLHINLHRRSNSGDEEIFAILSELTTLRTLSLQGLNPTKQGLTDLAKLTELQSLDLESTLIDDEGLRLLSSLQKLQHLSLKNTLVTGRAVPHLEKYPQLTSLSLELTRLTAEEFQQLVAIENLEHLEVSNTQFSGKSLMALASMSRLRSVAAQQSRVTPYDVEDFSEIRNNVDITVASATEQ